MTTHVQTDAGEAVCRVAHRRLLPLAFAEDPAAATCGRCRRVLEARTRGARLAAAARRERVAVALAVLGLVVVLGLLMRAVGPAGVHLR